MTDEQKALTVQAREKTWQAHRDGTDLQLDAAEASALWLSILDDVKQIHDAHNPEANIERLNLLIEDAHAKMLEHGTSSMQGIYYEGLRAGLRRAINVLEGNG